MNTSKYHNKADNEAKEIVKPIADQISSLVNRISSGHKIAKALGRAMCEDHRTLVQIKMHMILEFVRALSKNYEEGRYDLRNEASCRMAHKMVKAIEGDDCLPYV